ncbi:MAG TPA: inorganic phosphate transporter [Candidatus Limnocylindrales bacterium]|nr:inorganic phosphate transporter [Candidatus Limnocylindrales bacterium]
MPATTLVACLYGIISGFNDGGNLLAAMTAGRVISRRQALLLLLAVALGPILLGTAVAQTVAYRIIDLPGQGVRGLVLIPLVSILVVLASWRARVPTSMTLSLVGAMVGWALAGGSVAAVHWVAVVAVLVGTAASVLAGGLLAFWAFAFIQRLLGGLPHARVLAFTRVQALTSLLLVFAYGGNDLEKVVGLIGISLVLPGHAAAFAGLQAVGLAVLTFLLGTVIGGWGIAERIGFGISRMSPLQALTEQFAAGSVVAALAVAGVPVSMTQTTGGALIGVGAAFRASAVRWAVVRSMLASWLIAFPSALVLAFTTHRVWNMVG